MCISVLYNQHLLLREPYTDKIMSIIVICQRETFICETSSITLMTVGQRRNKIVIIYHSNPSTLLLVEQFTHFFLVIPVFSKINVYSVQHF